MEPGRRRQPRSLDSPDARGERGPAVPGAGRHRAARAVVVRSALSRRFALPALRALEPRLAAGPAELPVRDRALALRGRPGVALDLGLPAVRLGGGCLRGGGGARARGGTRRVRPGRAPTGYRPVRALVRSRRRGFDASARGHERAVPRRGRDSVPVGRAPGAVPPVVRIVLRVRAGVPARDLARGGGRGGSGLPLRSLPRNRSRDLGTGRRLRGRALRLLHGLPRRAGPDEAPVRAPHVLLPRGGGGWSRRGPLHGTAGAGGVPRLLGAAP